MPSDPMLIVDDNPANLKLVRKVLTTEGYDIRTAADSQEAFAILKDFHPRLILMDVQLPGTNGFELTRRLKSDPATSDIIVIAITAYAVPGDEERAQRAGCSGYVTKPIDTRTLGATVKLHLGTRQVAKPAFQAGDYHDLLAELRTTFLVESEEATEELLYTLTHGVDADRIHRISHRWAGIAGTLGLVEIARKARSIEEFLIDPAAQHNNLSVLGPIATGEYISRLRSELLSILRMFSDAVQGKRETPALPPAAWQALSHKMFAVVGFEHAEAARIIRALAHGGSRAQTFEEVLDTVTLLPFDGAVVNVCQGQSAFAWIHTGVFAGSGKPVLFVGSAETLLRREPRISERSCDFLLGPWDTDELVFRIYRLFSPNADCQVPRPENLRHGAELPVELAHTPTTISPP